MNSAMTNAAVMFSCCAYHHVYNMRVVYKNRVQNKTAYKDETFHYIVIREKLLEAAD